ncbi:ATP citrate lyase citrate-binding [Rhizoctonia solani]|uniref:ATP citrate synthase n=1 Tax=Rhizoctonia solani TaxID=456999 RepID=A0A8H7IHT0_9AGAM|nr:ATP citrate lyase citrate-binding [Rhizoctonia solani]
MSSKAIREFDAKLLLAYWLPRAPAYAGTEPVTSTFVYPTPKVAQIAWDAETNTVTPDTQLPPWVSTEKLVAKPDQLIKRRGKAGLLSLNKGWEESKAWIVERAGKPVQVESVTGTLNNFIVEPFLPHPSNTEYYICINSQREGDEILFTHEGGVRHWRYVKSNLLAAVPAEKQDTLYDFLSRLYSVYVDLHFAYLEINPLVCLDATPNSPPTIHFLDMAAKLDQTADSICAPKWAIARDLSVYTETSAATAAPGAKIQLDRGPPMLTVLNPNGRVWTMVAGGGASVVYSDAIAAHGFAHELANYDGKILIIGGGIANFTNVAATFKGIIRALKAYKAGLQAHNVKIFVRRGGPNYQEGLRPETHITEIVPLALGVSKRTPQTAANVIHSVSATAQGSPKGVAIEVPDAGVGQVRPDGGRNQPNDQIVHFDATAPKSGRPSYRPFDASTRSFVYGLQPRAIQGMLDFDYSCGRETPSVAAMIYPFGGHHIQKFYWGTKETLLPVYTSVKEAVEKHPDADVVVNFASSRSVFGSTKEILQFPQIKAIALIAEGVPERHAREILHAAQEKGVLIIGPATVGGIKPGCFRIGTREGDMMDNIIASKLYRPGSVGYVSKSGGMSNELNNILSLVTNGTYEGIAIGGDRYPGTSFIDHLLRRGVEEYRVIDAVKEGKITKPIVAWAIGTCAKMFATEVQFGHAGSMANSDKETADAKNAAMRAAGFVVPDTFEDLPLVLQQTYESLVAKGAIVPSPERDPPVIPMDYKWAQELGLIRKPAAFISTISDERGQELIYAGMRISDVFKEDIGLGGVVALLWFKRRLPAWATKFIEMVLMLTADHGPAVSGAMNTIVASRAGKDLISSLASGLLTIGSRFGGALDEAASMFSNARDTGLTPREFVDESRRANKLISGIGHKIKSVNNPDLRVELVKEYVKKNFPFAFAIGLCSRVEKVTTAKKDTLILNVDGCIAVCFVDLLRDSGSFTREEADEYIRIGTLNGLFVLGRSIGFIGHHLGTVPMLIRVA